MVSATLLLHAMGLGLGWSLRGANVWVPRLLGGAVAALGSALLFMQLTN
jgi:urease accessory protein